MAATRLGQLQSAYFVLFPKAPQYEVIQPTSALTSTDDARCLLRTADLNPVASAIVLLHHAAPLPRQAFFNIVLDAVQCCI